MKKLLITLIIMSLNTKNKTQKKLYSWMNNKLYVHHSPVSGVGIFTRFPVHHHERLAVFGGKVMNQQELLFLNKDQISYVLQIDDDLWLGNTENEPEDADFFNHSCNPNSGFKNPYTLVAMRDIEAGEEITFDYAMVVTQFVGIKAFKCTCGAENCRKLISENDWKDHRLQKKYLGYFSSYIREKMST